MSKVDELLNRIEDSDFREELRRELERHGDVVDEGAENSEENLLVLLEDLMKRIPEEVPQVQPQPGWQGQPPWQLQEVVMYGPQPTGPGEGTADPPFQWITTTSDSIWVGDPPEGSTSSSITIEAHSGKAPTTTVTTAPEDGR